MNLVKKIMICKKIIPCLFFFFVQPSYLPDYTVYTKPSTHIARLGNKVAQSFFTSENLRQSLLQRQTACLSFPVSEDDCPTEVDNYHSLCPLEPVDKTPPEQVRGGGGVGGGGDGEEREEGGGREIHVD